MRQGKFADLGSRASAAATAMAAILFALAAGGCSDDGGGGGAQPASVVSMGTVSALGSVIVNGIEFDDAGAAVYGDNVRMTVADARKVGASLRITGTVAADGATGTAGAIEINNELRGTVTAKGADSFTVLGQTVVVDGGTVYGGAAGFSALIVGDRVEVHGYRTSAGSIIASRVEIAGPGGNDEIRGAVSGKTATTFVVGNLTILYGASTTIVPQGRDFSDGDVVEVQLQGNEAVLIEIEEGFPEGQEVEIEGFVTGFVSHPGTFRVAGTPVRTTSATEFSGGQSIQIANDVKVEAEGRIEGGVLVAHEIEFEESIVIMDNASGVGATMLTLLGKTVLRTSMTVPNDAVADGDGVEVRGFLNTDGSITALELHNLGAPVAAGLQSLQAPVSSVDAGMKTLVMIGITIDASGAGVEFELDDGVPADANSFFGAVRPRDTVARAEGAFAPATSTMAATLVEIE